MPNMQDGWFSNSVISQSVNVFLFLSNKETSLVWLPIQKSGSARPLPEANVWLAGFAGEIEMPAIRGIRAIAHQLHPCLSSSLLPLTGFPELRIHPLFLLKGMQELYAGSILSEGNFVAINAITPLY